MTLLCYANGVHLANDTRVTLCGNKVYDVPLVPRQVEALTCQECYYIDLLPHAPYRCHCPDWYEGEDCDHDA